MHKIAGKSLEQWEQSHPLIARISKAQEVFWWNRNMASVDAVLPSLDIRREDIADAEARLQRFAPLIAKLFPQTAHAQGIIESSVVDIPLMRRAMCGDPSVSGTIMNGNAGPAFFSSRSPACSQDCAPSDRTAVSESSGSGSSGVCDTPNGRLMLKCDYDLPVSGSIKARGGIYEVLKHAETLAVKHGLLRTGAYQPTGRGELYNDAEDTSLSVSDKERQGAGNNAGGTSHALAGCDYRELASAKARELFGKYSIAVGSTGNLGLSIGIMGSALGFRVTVHMSSDARQWKKDLLRAKGVTVIEYEADYGKAVEQGRKEAEADPTCHFVDDENSRDLFMGYAVAGERLKTQLAEMKIAVDADHPLFVYLPCGVGGGPGGVAFGLKCAFGDNVHCFFAEPTHSPAMLLGLYTGLHDAVSVQDFGLDNKTAADGLAVGRPSGFVGTRMERLIDGVFTVSDHTMHRQLAQLADAHGIYMEPSALAGMSGMLLATAAHDYLRHHGLALSVKHATHLVWGTGGSMVPQMDMQRYYAMGKALL